MTYPLLSRDWTISNGSQGWSKELAKHFVQLSVQYLRHMFAGLKYTSQRIFHEQLSLLKMRIMKYGVGL